MVSYFIKFSNECFITHKITNFFVLYTYVIPYHPPKDMDRSLRIAFAFADAFNTLAFNKLRHTI